MAQHDFVIANQGFPATRADINNFLQAVATTHSGTSTPSGAVAGTIWLDTTTATAPILKYYDGTDNITLATINHVANTVNFSDSALDLLTDTTPQLGGNLDVNGNSIVSVSNANITLAPNGTGDVVLSADTIKIGDANANATITTDGTGDLILNTNSGSSSGSITIADGANADITIEPNGTGDVLLNADTVRVGDSGANATITSNGAGDLILNTNSGTNSGSITIPDGANANITIAPNGTGDILLDADTVRIGDSNADAILTTNGTGDITVSTNSGTNSGTVKIFDGVNGNIEITPNGTGVVKLDGLSYPTSDGTVDQVLKTNGSGVLSFGTASAGAGQVIQVVSTTKTDTFSASVATASLSGTVTGLTATITPASASNKILVLVHGHFSASSDAATFTNLYRNSTQICLADTSSSRGRKTSGSIGDGYSLPSTAITFLDSPTTTSSVTYSLQLSHINASTITVYANRTSADNDASRFGRFTSTITLMEIKG